jgi:hypothetical protein
MRLKPIGAETQSRSQHKPGVQEIGASSIPILEHDLGTYPRVGLARFAGSPVRLRSMSGASARFIPTWRLPSR